MMLGRYTEANAFEIKVFEYSSIVTTFGNIVFHCP